MKILVTGNMGYVGSLLTGFISRYYPSYEVTGFDSGYFASNVIGSYRFPEIRLSKQIFGDVRNIDESVLSGIDAVVHLAAISNDPMGEEFADVTYAVNQTASIALAHKAACAGVKNFVFASSCSIYGEGGNERRSENDLVNPLSHYAISKINVEHALESGDLSEMVTTSLRFATACGWSERLRVDLVLNDFVCSALRLGVINILSDGTPWRPLIDVNDMARAICWAMSRGEAEGGRYLKVNTGSDEYNYQVRDLATAVADKISGTKININKDAQPDKRSYLVDFSLFRSLAPQFQPQISLSKSIDNLVQGLSAHKGSVSSADYSDYVRLNKLRSQIKHGYLDKNLIWTSL